LKGKKPFTNHGSDSALTGVVGSQNKNNKQKDKRNMKKNIIRLQMTALLLAAALQGAVAAEIPFKGAFEAVEAAVVEFPTVTVAGLGAGHATQLGKFTMVYDAQVNLLTRVGIGSVEFIAANGDRLFADLLGLSSPSGTPNVLSIAEVFTITGGTGRFADATGSLSSTRLKDQITGETSGSFEGTISIR
jgi:hypothetical protein